MLLMREKKKQVGLRKKIEIMAILVLVGQQWYHQSPKLKVRTKNQRNE